VEGFPLEPSGHGGLALMSFGRGEFSASLRDDADADHFTENTPERTHPRWFLAESPGLSVRCYSGAEFDIPFGQ